MVRATRSRKQVGDVVMESVEPLDKQANGRKSRKRGIEDAENEGETVMVMCTPAEADEIPTTGHESDTMEDIDAAESVRFEMKEEAKMDESIPSPPTQPTQPRRLISRLGDPGRKAKAGPETTDTQSTDEALEADLQFALTLSKSEVGIEDTEMKEQEMEESSTTAPSTATATASSTANSKRTNRGRGRNTRTTKRPPSRRKKKAADGDDDNDDDGDESDSDNAPPLPPPTQEPTRRSGRTRAPPSDPYNATLALEASRVKAKAPRKTGGGGRKKKMTDDELWTPENMATKNSPLTRIDPAQIFNQSFVENVLTPEQRTHLISLLPACDLLYPSTTDLSTADPNPTIDHSIWTSPAFKDALTQWKLDLSSGKYEPSYIAKGEAARQRRMAGDFDSWKDSQFELYWGQKQRLEHEAVAGETSKVKIQDMVKHGVFKTGDVFSMRRKFQGGVFVRKDARLVGINPENHTLSFTYPAGTAEWELGDVVNKTIEGVVNITALENTLCREHPDVPEKIPNGNAFKTIRIIRKGEDIGCVFDLRSRFYYQYLKGEEEGDG
ncbi:hypothetical protein EX30DRAFT_395854 [Ascodesmis nigricans]|uniref:DEUBAD domain-containing protein n=1 Tax=Ascodesmis nigricans TaxID=341454 RepID=A0A4S2MWL8_9PEZI|nr:hypothetical protein EX30DRAFT_395854 [Ascodesmis nigricans]